MVKLYYFHHWPFELKSYAHSDFDSDCLASSYTVSHPRAMNVEAVRNTCLQFNSNCGNLLLISGKFAISFFDFVSVFVSSSFFGTKKGKD